MSDLLLKELVDRTAIQDNRIEELLQAVKNPGPLQYMPAPVNDGDVRKAKVQSINLNIRKSNRLKLFKASTDNDIELFLKKITEELNNMKVLVGLTEDLTRNEYVPLFRSCLDYPVVERVSQVLTSEGKTWENVTIAELTKFMKQEFGSKQTDVANVIKMFGPQRLVKRKDESAADHYFRWFQNIPEIMKPNDDQSRIDFVDLIMRAMYFVSLEDDYLQKELSDSKEPKPDLKKCFNEVISAESRLKALK